MFRGLMLLANWTGLPRLMFRLVLDRRVPLRLKLILAAAVVYIVSPLDFVPDILPVLGFTDDVLVLVLSVAIFLGLSPSSVVAEHMRSRSRGGDSDPKTIEGDYRVLDDEESQK